MPVTSRSRVLPSGNTGPTSLKMDRVILWISAGILAVIGQNVIKFDMLATLGVGSGDTDLIWNILVFMALTEAMDSFARKKTLVVITRKIEKGRLTPSFFARLSFHREID